MFDARHRLLQPIEPYSLFDRCDPKTDGACEWRSTCALGVTKSSTDLDRILLQRSLYRFDYSGSEDSLMKKISADVTGIDVTYLSSRPYRLEARAVISRHVRVVSGANSDDQFRVDWHLEILQMRAFVHYAAHKLQRFVLAPFVVRKERHRANSSERILGSKSVGNETEGKYLGLLLRDSTVSIVGANRDALSSQLVDSVHTRGIMLRKVSTGQESIVVIDNFDHFCEIVSVEVVREILSLQERPIDRRAHHTFREDG